MTQERDVVAWRPTWETIEGQSWCLPIPFGRRMDAELAMQLLAKHIPHPERLTCDEFKTQFAAIGGGLQETCNLLVATCCQW
jgi:hypothetical protein